MYYKYNKYQVKRDVDAGGSYIIAVTVLPFLHAQKYAYLYGGRDTPGTLATRYVPQDTLVTRLYENIEAIRYNPGIQPGNYLLCCPS